jgi:hypothetical protein
MDDGEAVHVTPKDWIAELSLLENDACFSGTLSNLADGNACHPLQYDSN